MSTRSRLFTRTVTDDPHTKFLSSENTIIVLQDIFQNGDQLLEQLRQIPDTRCIRANNINDCLNLMIDADVKNTFTLLIISNRFLHFVCHRLLKIVPQLSHIYLFDSAVGKNYPSRDRRFRGTFDNIDPLMMKLHKDIAAVRSSYRDTEGMQYVIEDDAKFFWYRFFFSVLNHLQGTNNARIEPLIALHTVYKNNPRELRQIERFVSEYQTDQVIQWYTRNSFFYRDVNKALRSHNINQIFLWRAYIHDLDAALRELCSVETDSCSKVVYRGQVMHAKDLLRLQKNVGKLVNATSFWSTALRQEVASMFTCCDHYDSIQSVLFNIHIDSDHSKLAAEIKHLSEHREEEEFLFSFRSMFRIQDVQFTEECWHVKLLAVDEDDQEFTATVNPWKAAIGEQSFFSGRHQPLFTRYLTGDHASFLSFQLLIDLMLRLDQTDFARREMIDLCRLKYTGSQSDLRKIDEFERDYRNNDAVRWYTTDSFLYRLLQQALRMEDIDTIFKLRYYIYDLHNQLARLQIMYLNSLAVNESILTLYRGQRMKWVELKRLQGNIGELISMNGFLSTTNDIAAAVFFAGDGCLDDPEGEVSVSYQISIDTSVPHSVPFAPVQYLSVFEAEVEVLFSMALVFEIHGVEQYGSLWVVEMALINKEDETWDALTAHLDS